MLLIALTLLNLAHAEYRVFELIITNPTTGQERTVRSNLTPAQYRQFYGMTAQETVMYTDTWKCFGNTSRKPFCPNPKDQGQAPTNPSRP